jgi:protein dithiol oxidoreductase (disulfide-forming)
MLRLLLISMLVLGVPVLATDVQSNQRAPEHTAKSSPPDSAAPKTERWHESEQYVVLSPAHQTQVGAGRIEVLEFFDYGCPHCSALEPYLAQWSKTKPDYIVFTAVPIIWGENNRPFAQLHYALQALHREDLRQAVFDTIHRDKMPLRANGADATNGTFALLLAFAEAHGIPPTTFTETYHSAAVGAQVARAEELRQQYQITGVPTLIVNGKYVSDVGKAGDQTRLIELITDLAARERRLASKDQETSRDHGQLRVSQH